jgi:hypothetical protein
VAIVGEVLIRVGQGLWKNLLDKSYNLKKGDMMLILSIVKKMPKGEDRTQKTLQKAMKNHVGPIKNVRGIVKEVRSGMGWSD